MANVVQQVNGVLQQTGVSGGFFGDGSDGPIAITVDVVVTGNVYASTLNVQAGKTLTASSVQLYVADTLTVAAGALVDCSGSAGSDGGALTPGSHGLGGGVGSGLYQSGQQGGDGGTASNGVVGVGYANPVIGLGGAGGIGGAGAHSGGAGGALNGIVAAAGADLFRALPLATLFSLAVGGQVFAFGGGTGGGGGSGDGTSGGGGGGGGGGIFALIANTLNLVGTLQSNGGNGGIGYGSGLGATGGGAGGGGGRIVIICNLITYLGVTYNAKDYTGADAAAALIAAGAVSVIGGTGGAGGNGGASGADGSDGELVIIFN